MQAGAVAGAREALSQDAGAFVQPVQQGAQVGGEAKGAHDRVYCPAHRVV